MFEPKYYIIKIQDSYLAELLYLWIQYDKPCKLTFQKPRLVESMNLTGVRTTVTTNEAADFILKVKSVTGCKLLQEDANHNLLENQ